MSDRVSLLSGPVHVALADVDARLAYVSISAGLAESGELTTRIRASTALASKRLREGGELVGVPVGPRA